MGLEGAPSFSVHHVNVVAGPGLVDATADFWRQLFGLVDLPRQGRSGRPGAWLAGSDAEIHISERDGPTHPDAHCAVIVAQVAEVAAAARRLGAEWEDAPPVIGSARGFTRDPAGNRIEVMQTT